MGLSKAAARLADMTAPRLDRGALAKKLGVSKSTLSDWCRGKTVPSVENMRKLADEGIIPAGEWFEDAPPPAKAVG